MYYIKWQSKKFGYIESRRDTQSEILKLLNKIKKGKLGTIYTCFLGK